MRKAKLLSTLAFLALLIIPASRIRAEIPATLTLPDFHRQILLNGTEIFMFPANQERVPFTLLVANGAAFDPAGKWGLTYLMTRMMVEAGKDRTGQPILPALRQLGSELSYKVEWDGIWMQGTAPAGQLAETLNLLAQMVIQPQFEEEALEKYRRELIQELQKKAGEPRFETYQRFLSELFDGNPYGHLIRGDVSTLPNIQLPDVKLQYRKLFIPNSAHLAFYYAGDEATTFNALTRRWGSWVKGNPLPFAFRKAQPAREMQILILDRPLKESVSRWGTLGVGHGDRNAYTLKVLEQYLTLSLPGWASQVAAAQQVQASASVENRMMPGLMEINLQAPPEQMPAYLKKFQETLAEIEQGQMPKERFEQAKQLAFMEMRNAIGSQETLLRQLLETSLYGVGVNYILNFGLRIDRVTPELFQSTLKEYFALNKLVVVVAGPAESLQTQLSGFGKVRLLN